MLWIVSWWFDGVVWYVLWVVGFGLDLWFLVIYNWEWLFVGFVVCCGCSRWYCDIEELLDVVDVDVFYFIEWFGLFVIIVIGEGLV